METSLYDFYGWSPYWGDSSYMGMVGYMGLGGYWGYVGGPMAPPPSPELLLRERQIDAAERSKSNPSLRSIMEVIGYHIDANDGEVGHVNDILVEDADWSIHYLVVDTKTWWPGKKVLISPLSVREIRWADRMVSLGVNRQKVKDSSAYDPSMTVDPIYESKFHKHYDHLRQFEKA
jgi:hypothetical protein